MFFLKCIMKYLENLISMCPMFSELDISYNKLEIEIYQFFIIYIFPMCLNGSISSIRLISNYSRRHVCDTHFSDEGI